MKTTALPFSKPCLILAAALCFTGSLQAQAPNANDRANPGADARPTIPAADKLTRLGQVATAAEAKPLIEKYYAEQEQLFQQRREAILTLKGKPPEEQLKIMQALVADQRERRQKNRELESRISAMLKQDREERLPKKATVGHGR